MLYINSRSAEADALRAESQMSASAHDHPQQLPASALSAPASMRFAAVAGLIALLWLAVGWALSWW
jgi:hypothetical protein